MEPGDGKRIERHANAGSRSKGHPRNEEESAMTDPDVQREIDANKLREVDAEREAEDDGPIIDTAERVMDPLVDPLVPDEVENDEVENDDTVLDPEEARRNDEAQRPD
jgi:hypothetical protein